MERLPALLYVSSVFVLSVCSQTVIPPSQRTAPTAHVISQPTIHPTTMSQPTTAPSFNAQLRAELLQMAKEDQATREALLRAGAQDPALNTKVQEIDRRNMMRMKEIVAIYRWPGKSLVSEDGAAAAWLLVQHADADLAFQEQCLALIREAAERGEASMQHVAYLTDRVLVAEGKKQIYGTQFRTEQGKLVPAPIEDEANVNRRRKAVGLSSIEEYEQILREMYATPEPTNTDCCVDR